MCVPLYPKCGRCSRVRAISPPAPTSHPHLRNALRAMLRRSQTSSRPRTRTCTCPRHSTPGHPEGLPPLVVYLGLSLAHSRPHCSQGRVLAAKHPRASPPPALRHARSSMASSRGSRLSCSSRCLAEHRASLGGEDTGSQSQRCGALVVC